MKKIGITNKGEMVPKSMDVPIRVIIKPRYIGFLVYRNAPFVTMRLARVPGIGFVPSLRNNMALPTLSNTPPTMNRIPIYRQG
jgi:hypothetical protein